MDRQTLPLIVGQTKPFPLQRWRQWIAETWRTDWRGSRLLSYGVLLLVISALIVAAYYINHPALETNPDTPGYIVVAQRMLSGGSPADPVRTPGYLLFIALIWLVTGSRQLE